MLSRSVCLTLCYSPMGYSPPCSSVHGILQAVWWQSIADLQSWKYSCYSWYFISWVKDITEQELQPSLWSFLMMPPPTIVSNSRIYTFNLMFHAELFVLILNQEEQGMSWMWLKVALRYVRQIELKRNKYNDF